MADEDALDRVLVSIDALCKALLVVTHDGSFRSFLQHLTNLARGLVGARYCALGVVDGDTLADFIVSGVTDAEREAIGPLPHGHGLLGVLIHDRQSLRLADLRADPRAVGFPPNHPPMSSFLGVPIALGDTVFGNLYLTEKVGATEFSPTDQQMVERLARHAAITIGNARRLGEVEEILEELPVPIIIRTVPSLRLLVMNRRARQLVGDIPAFRSDVQEIAGALRARRPDGTPFATAELPTVRASVTGKPVEGIEILVDDREGNILALAVSAVPLTDASGVVTAVATVYHDVTLEHEGAWMRERVLAHLAAELNPALAAIRGAIAMLLMGAEDVPDTVRTALQADLMAESDRLGHLIANVRAFAKAQAGELPIVRQSVAIPDLLRAAVHAFQLQTTAHRFVVAAPEDLPMANADAELIALVVHNLADNAVRYAPSGGTVTLSAQVDKTELIVGVRDEGPGFLPTETAETAEHLAGPGAGQQGLGMGLILSRRIIAAHGGRLWIESMPGTGTTVRFTLPISTARDSAAAPASPTTPLLTERERDVLDGMARGWTNRQIARALGVKASTVQTHVGNILAKLGATDRTQAAVRATGLGLIRPESAE